MSCFGGTDEQIYLVELTVERLRLTADKYREDFVDSPPLVKLKFIDFPVFVITRRDRDPSSSSPEVAYDESAGLLYACGKSCLFMRKPRDLVAAMQSQPLQIGIFRGEEIYPIAEGTVPLSGCLCDQVTMVGNDADHRPKPYEKSGNYNLVDPGENHAGSIKIFLRLTFFGSYIISHYDLYEDSCVFQNDFDGELRVMKVDEEVRAWNVEKINDDNIDRNKTDEEKFKIDEGTVLATLRNEETTKGSKKKCKKKT